MLWCLKEREKIGKNSRVNVYAPKNVFIEKKVIFKDTPPSILRTIYEMKNATHKQTIHRETKNNRTEDIDIFRNRDNNQIKKAHVK